MKIEYLEPVRTERFNLGWSRRVKANGVVYQIGVRPGKRVRLAYSRKYGYHWHVTVYREGEGAVVSGMPCDKTSSVKAILEEALYRDFCEAAFGKLWLGRSIEDEMYYRHLDARFNENDPRRVAWRVLNECYRYEGLR